MPELTCSIDGCDRQHCARGWCKMHYKRWKANGDATVVQRIARRSGCLIEDCTGSHASNGYCKMHATRLARTGAPLGIRPGRRRTPCSVEGCDLPSSAKGLCGRHYKRPQRSRATPARSPWGQRSKVENVYSTNSAGAGVLTIQREGRPDVVTLYDVADHATVATYRWTSKEDGYIVSSDRTSMPLARLILGLQREDPRRGDHISGDVRDNRRANLRAVSHRLNIAHQAVINGRGTSRFRNVYWSASDRRWTVQVTIKYVVHHVGMFLTESEAAEAAADFRVQHGLPSGY